MQYKFRNHIIKRTCTSIYSEHSLYKPALQKDFNNRCAYCNLLDSTITTPFEVDHFIPKKIFKGIFDEFDTLYENLIYSCKKCNMTKSSKYSGELVKIVVENLEFYNPAEIDMNEIFFRNEYGFIMSSDIKGKEMILKLNLHYPIHALAWILERINYLADAYEFKIKKCTEFDKKNQYENIHNRLNFFYRKLNSFFVKNYNNKYLDISRLLD